MSLGEEGKEKGGEGKRKKWRSIAHIPGKVRDLNYAYLEPQYN